MKLSAVSLLVASLALQASASPIRIVALVPVPPTAPTAPTAPTLPTAPIPPIHHFTNVSAPGTPSRGCAGMHAKALRISNMFRQALGLPLIEPAHADVHVMTHKSPKPLAKEVMVPASKSANSGILPPLPILGFAPSVGASKSLVEVTRIMNVTNVHADPHVHHHGHGHGHGRGRGHMFAGRHRCASFMRRVHRALMSLGPWEGRAVAFVLGCGIGVLLRMFWVIALLALRAISPASSASANNNTRSYYGEEDGETVFVFDVTEAEALLAPPPQYPVDEKVAVPEPAKPAEVEAQT